MANADDAADRAAAQAEKLTGGLFKGIKPKVPETDEGGTWWERLCLGQSIVMVDSGFSALFGLFGLFGIFAFLAWGVYGIVWLIFDIIKLALMAFIFYTSFNVSIKRRRSFASLQIVLAAAIFALGVLEAIILAVIPIGVGHGLWVGGFYGFGIGGAIVSIFWYAPIVVGAILTMLYPQLTWNKIFNSSAATSTASTGQAAQPAPPPPPAHKPRIPAASIHVSKAGISMGPFDRATFDTKLAAGEFSRDDLVYADNNQWVPIKDCL